MTKFETATIDQMEQDGIELPAKAREELKRGLATTIVSRTVEHTQYTHIHKGLSLVELAERQRIANERRAGARNEGRDEY